MRIPIAVPGLVAFVMLFPAAQSASADDSKPNQQSVNSGQLVTPATLGVDDKSPMSQSLTNPPPAPPSGALDLIKQGVRKFYLLGPAPGQPATRLTLESAMQNSNVRGLNVEDPDVYAKLSPAEALILGDPARLAGIPIDPAVREYLRLRALRRYGSTQRYDFLFQQADILDDIDAQIRPYFKKWLDDLSPADVIGSALTIASGLRTTPVTQIHDRAEFSDGLLGYDVSSEVDNTIPQSLSFGFRYDVSPTRLHNVMRIARYVQAIAFARARKNMRVDQQLNTDELVAASMLYVGSFSDAARAAVAIAHSLHAAFSSGYTSLNGLGSITAYGFSVSALRSFPCVKGAFTLLGSVQDVSLAPQHLGRINALVPGAALMWQDAVSSLDVQGNAHIARWRTQAGIEYDSLFGFPHTRDTYGVFLRRRLACYSEVKFTAVVDTTNSVRFGLEFGHTFGVAATSN